MVGGWSAPLLNGNSPLQRWPTNRGRRPGPSVLFWQSASHEDRAPNTLTLALSHRMGEGGGLRLAVKLLHHLPKVVLAYVHDAHFALGVLFRVAGMGGVDHDGLPEFAPNRPGRGLGRVGRA